MRDQIPVDAYVLDTLMRDLVGHDREPSAFVVYMILWRRITMAQSGRVHLSHDSIAQATGLSRRTVQRAIGTLVRRRLVRSQRSGPTATPEYSLVRHWQRHAPGQ
jgi:DNA-binding GntR family transcriptional regulator